MTYVEIAKEVYLYGCNNHDDWILAIFRTTFRTIFDPASSEWDSTTVDEKLLFIDLVKKGKAFSFTFDNLVTEYKAMWERVGRPDIAVEIDIALKLLGVSHA